MECLGYPSMAVILVDTVNTNPPSYRMSLNRTQARGHLLRGVACVLAPFEPDTQEHSYDQFEVPQL